MAQAAHSDLEVVPKAEAPEQQKYAYYGDEPQPYHAQHGYYDTDGTAYTSGEAQAQSSPATICGMKKKTFWLVLIVAIVVIAAAVGGGVGGALASKSSNTSNSSSPANSVGAQSSALQSQSSRTPTPTSQSSASISTTTLVGPSSTTILRDCPSSNHTLYDVILGDTKMTFRKECSISFLNANGIDSVVGVVVPSLNECINRCAAFNINNQTVIEKGGRACNSVCWRNTFDTTVNDFPGGMCFGFTSTNTSGQFTFRTPVETRCDSAALITNLF